MKSLLLITRSYPYDNTESFLENEILYLSHHFETIYIVPEIIKSDVIRSVPGNVIVLSSYLNNLNRKLDWILLRAFWHFIYFFTSNLIFSKRSRIKNQLLHVIKHLSYFEKEYRKYCILYPIIHSLGNRKNQIIGYSYWMHRSALAMALLKYWDKIDYFISRVHGIDLHDERWETKTIPFREFKIYQCDKIFPISKYNDSYLRGRIKRKFYQKIQVSYLGVSIPDQFKSQKSNIDTYTIVTCANLYPLKRIDYIPTLLKELTMKIRWVHFGDGPKRPDLLKASEILPSNIQFDFMGQVKNKDVLDFYLENYVDLFLSISLSEGLPVSMMEAQSYGIPVFAVNVGGISEIIVDGVSGKLFYKNTNLKQVAKSINDYLPKQDHDRNTIRGLVKKKFDRNINYVNFINGIKTVVQE